MFDSLVKGLAHILSWMFVVGMAGSVFLVIPVAAYQLFKVLFEGTARRKPIPQCLRRGFARFSSMINSPGSCALPTAHRATSIQFRQAQRLWKPAAQ